MKRLSLYLSAIALALVPAAIGLLGNASFSEAVPVRVPPSAQVAATTSPTPNASSSPSGSATSDDEGGRTDRDCRTEAGDDRRVNGNCASGTATPRSGTSGADDSTSSSRPSGGHGSDGSTSSSSSSGGHGSDDSGSDDRGSGGHGSDD